MVSYTLIVTMLIVSVSTLIWPSLADVLGGVGDLPYPWQPWTAVFVHGWPGMPMFLHLTGNLVLLAFVGPGVERCLGFIRFLTVTLLAILAAGLLRILSGVEFNGASAFIWAYAPVLWLLIRDGEQTDKIGILYVMWLIVPLAMGLNLTLNGTHPIKAFVLGNLYHISGTVVGFGAAWFWRDWLLKNL
jgi:membrane associated rhomboid family serine protease